MTEAYNKLKQLLDELFQFDRADLDFGIYRIMNRKREEVSSFLDNDLLPQGSSLPPNPCAACACGRR